jgi:hypothetical protein
VSGGARAGRREDDSGATLVPGWRSGELADVIRRLLRGLLAACRLASDGVAGVTGTGGRQTAAVGFQAGQHRELRALGAAGPAGIPAPASRPGPAAAAGSRIVHLFPAPRACTVTGKPFTVAGSAVP